MIRRVGVLGAALLLGACASAGSMDSEEMASMAAPSGDRCYQFERNPAADRLGLPWGFVRSEEPLDEYAGLTRFRAYTLDGPEARRDFPFQAWWVDPDGETIKIGAEVSGTLQLEMRGDGRALSGRAIPIGDAIQFGADEIDRTPTEGVVAQEVLCGAWPGGAEG